MINSLLKIFITAAILILIFSAGCNRAKEVKKNEDKNAHASSINEHINAIDTIFARGRDTLLLPKDGIALLKGFISDNHNKPKYTLPVWKGQKVTATVKPLIKGGNVRFTQVQQPGGEFDGPFGDSVYYHIESHGNLHFIIGGNQMAGETYTGGFILYVMVK